jgi:hypothetical protein
MAVRERPVADHRAQQASLLLHCLHERHEAVIVSAAQTRVLRHEQCLGGCIVVEREKQLRAADGIIAAVRPLPRDCGRPVLRRRRETRPPGFEVTRRPQSDQTAYDAVLVDKSGIVQRVGEESHRCRGLEYRVSHSFSGVVGERSLEIVLEARRQCAQVRRREKKVRVPQQRFKRAVLVGVNQRVDALDPLRGHLIRLRLRGNEP